MAKLVIGPKTKVTINNVDLSDHVSEIDLGDSHDEVEVTGMGEPYKEYLPGIGDAQTTITFFQDYGSGSVDSVVYPLYASNQAGTIKITPDTSGTVVYTLVAKPYDYSPISGGVGAANTVQTTWRNAGTAGLTRGTA